MTRISRLTPPPRLTRAMPVMPSRRFATVLSTNQLSCSSVMSTASAEKQAIVAAEIDAA